MNIEYLKEKIYEELEGSCEYIKLALENKSEKNQWAMMFCSMSEMELSHAENLMNIFKEYYEAITSVYNGESIPKYMIDCKKILDEEYYELYSKNKYLIELFKK